MDECFLRCTLSSNTQSFLLREPRIVSAFIQHTEGVIYTCCFMYCCVCATGIGKMEPGKASSSAVATYALSSTLLSSLSILTVYTV